MDVIESLTPDLFIKKSAEVLEALSKDEVRSKIPLISNWENFDRLKDLQLVRFRGLVQNMLDPEVYLEVYQTKRDNDTMNLRNGKFRDNLKLEVFFSCHFKDSFKSHVKSKGIPDFTGILSKFEFASN